MPSASDVSSPVTPVRARASGSSSYDRSCLSDYIIRSAVEQTHRTPTATPNAAFTPSYKYVCALPTLSTGDRTGLADVHAHRPYFAAFVWSIRVRCARTPPPGTHNSGHTSSTRDGGPPPLPSAGPQPPAGESRARSTGRVHGQPQNRALASRTLRSQDGCSTVDARRARVTCHARRVWLRTDARTSRLRGGQSSRDARHVIDVPCKGAMQAHCWPQGTRAAPIPMAR